MVTLFCWWRRGVGPLSAVHGLRGTHTSMYFGLEPRYAGSHPHRFDKQKSHRKGGCFVCNGGGGGNLNRSRPSLVFAI